jgi:hypothetical protein
MVELRVVWILGVQAIRGGYSTHWENIYFYMYWIDKNIYILFMKLNQPYDEMYMLWDDLLVSIMFKLYQWCLRDSVRVKSID